MATEKDGTLMSKTSTEILEGVRDLLAKDASWVKCMWDSPGAGGVMAHCLEGAIRVVAELQDLSGMELLAEMDKGECGQARRKLRKHLVGYPYVTDGPGALMHFNDHPDTAHQDVLDALDKALADEEITAEANDDEEELCQQS